MSNILTLVDPDKEVKQEIIDLIEGLLAQAKDGNIRGIAIVTADPKRVVGTQWKNIDCFHEIHSGVSTLNTRMGSSIT